MCEYGNKPQKVSTHVNMRHITSSNEMQVRVGKIPKSHGERRILVQREAHAYMYTATMNSWIKIDAMRDVLSMVFINLHGAKGSANPCLEE
jgi:phosphoglucomutase